jgi:excisionase family DNA binding protein
MEKLLTVAEAAPLVNMSRQGLYAAIRAKQFPALHIGRRIRIPQSSVQQWIAEQMQTTTLPSDERLERDSSEHHCIPALVS